MEKATAVARMGHVDAPEAPSAKSLRFGALAQLGERLICIQEVIGSIPIGSTNPPPVTVWRAKMGR